MKLKILVESKYTVCAESTLTLWHGGNLEMGLENVSHRGGRWEYGPGLYLTTHYSTAKKYAKGSRKLYRITVRKGNDVKDVSIPLEKVQEFSNDYFIRSKKKDIDNRIQKYVKDGRVPADIFLNIIGNEQAIKNTVTDKLRSFLVEQDVDYAIVDNAFGWHETMLVLFDMKNIVKKEVITSKDKIEVYDLPTEFS